MQNVERIVPGARVRSHESAVVKGSRLLLDSTPERSTLINEFTHYLIEDREDMAQLSRRDRNAREKQERIFRAASELFAERGYGAVTTQEIAKRADVADGTLFRYAASKSELLLMVYNEEFRAALEAGEAHAQQSDRPVEAIMSLLEPALARARQQAENSAVYQRELLFGVAAERYRSEGLALVSRIEKSIAAVIQAAADDRGLVQDPQAIRVASAAIFAAMHLTIARSTTGAHGGADVFADLNDQVSQIVAGVLATLPSGT
ncbi:TetR/AcrR family transcriptional regulator [Glutamicibacter creatinolyticus]|uniref:TetR/AcrR family transcriptional regulator n=1 Tax=Micrococcaceae TaxID=1268 RepID=UPI000ADFEFD7|nr:helix-turn-helix domain containing protein [Arthrobacter sp. JCM 19049]